MEWADGPATWKQLRDLRQHGYNPDHHLTKTEAADLIRSLGGQQQTQTALVEKPAERSQDNAHHFRAAVDNARSTIGPGSQPKVDEAMARRQEFWVSTCRESTQLRAGSAQARELYRKQGCLFYEPTPAQAQQILNALDGALPFWDRDHPELFFQTLGLNFPQLVRRKWGT